MQVSLCWTAHCLRQFARGLEWVRLCRRRRHSRTHSRPLGESPQAAQEKKTLIVTKACDITFIQIRVIKLEFIN